MTNSTNAIIREIGIRKTARELGLKYHTQVLGWLDRGRVPIAHQTAFLELAKREGIPLTAEQLIRSQARTNA